jgi:hypothetical protein
MGVLTPRKRQYQTNFSMVLWPRNSHYLSLHPKEGISMRPVTKTWVNTVFSSPPAREVRGRSRWTHRQTFFSGLLRRPVFFESTGEFHAAQILEHFGRVGWVTRYKAQPFEMDSIGGRPKSIPDFLVELRGGELLVIEIKTYRFLSPHVLDRLQQNDDHLKQAGIRPLLWTDVDPNGRWNKLTPDTIHTIRHIARGLGFQLSEDRQQEIRGACTEQTTLGELLHSFSWDELTASIASTNIHVEIQGALNEKSQVFAHHPFKTIKHFFETGDASSKWWDSLPNF